MTSMKYASTNNALISALVNETYKFPTHDLALKFLRGLKDKFILAKGHEELLAAGKVKLWVRGYQQTPEEIEAGGLGNFCHVSIKGQKDGSYLLVCEKEALPPAQHPMKKRKATHMPNWGHPILKHIKAGASFEKYEDAVEMLYNLHQEFPETTIPNKDRLDLQVYSREGRAKPEMKKYRLQIQPGENSCTITIEEKLPKVKPVSDEPQDIIGRFTAQALMRKKKRK